MTTETPRVANRRLHYRCENEWARVTQQTYIPLPCPRGCWAVSFRPGLVRSALDWVVQTILGDEG